MQQASHMADGEMCERVLFSFAFVPASLFISLFCLCPVPVRCPVCEHDRHCTSDQIRYGKENYFGAKLPEIKAFFCNVLHLGENETSATAITVFKPKID